MIKAAHGLQRHGIDQAGRVCRDLEYPTVGLGHVGVGRGFDRFLAGQPGAPGGVAAAAVGRGAGQRQMLTHGFASLEIIDQGGRAAGQGATVLVGVIGLGGVQQAEAFVVETPGAHVAMKRLGPLQLMIAHQGKRGRRQGETAHAVGLARDQQAVVHGFAALGDYLIGKALGQVEQAVGIGLQRAIALDLIDVGLLARRLGVDVAGEAGEGEGRSPGRDQLAALQAHGTTPSGSKPLRAVADDSAVKLM
ncbi:hypothetical protein D3C80_1129450 [compost metagenome]